MQLLLLLVLVRNAFSQLDLCEPAVNPSPSCLCTRLDFMDTFSYRLRFGNSTFAGSNYIVSAPTFNPSYDCSSEEPLQCTSSSASASRAAFAVFNMKYVLELPDRIPKVFCYPNIRMFDMEGGLVKQFQSTGSLPADEFNLHLTEVGCIEYEASSASSPGSGPSQTGSTPAGASSRSSSTSSSIPSECNCPLPPPTMTQSTFNYRFAWQFPKTKYDFGIPQFVYSDTCQSVTMICNFPVSSVMLREKQSQKALMFFNEEYMISGNDIRDVASRFNLHCDSASGTWKFDSESETKFKGLLGVDTVRLTELGCATITEKA